MADRKLLRFSAVLVIAGAVVYQVASLFHGGSGRTANEVFTSYANSPSWALVHEAQFAGSAMFLFGLLALYPGLGVNSGIRGAVSRFASAMAVTALALNGALYAVDGVALKQAVDAWVSSPASQQAALFAVVQGVRGVEWGMRSYVNFATGLALVLFAIVIASTTRVKRPIGYIMGLSGLAIIAGGYGYGTAYTSLSDASIPFISNPTIVAFLTIAWTVWLLVITWRVKESVQAAPA